MAPFDRRRSFLERLDVRTAICCGAPVPLGETGAGIALLPAGTATPGAPREPG